MFICAFASLPIWAFYMFLGTALFVFFQQFPTPQAAAMLAGESKAEQVFPFFIIHHLSPGLTGLVIAAALAAAMSSLDSSINAITTVTIVDIYRRHVAKERDDRHYLRVAWVLATATACFMILGAILLARADTKTLQDTGTILASLLGAGLLGMYLLGFLTTRGDARAVWSGIACTVAFTGWTLMPAKWLPKGLHVPFDLYYASIIGNAIMFVVGYAAACWIFPSRRSLPDLTVWTRKQPTPES
jgi:SSS family solute:Na+ symporter